MQQQHQKIPLFRHCKELLALLGKKDTLSSAELSRTASALLKLQRGLTGGRELAGISYMDSKELLEAYLLYYWPVSYQQASYIINNCAFTFSEKKAVSVLDLGSGPAPVSAAVCDFLAAANQNNVALTFCDWSAKAVALAQKFFSLAFPDVHTDSLVCNFEKSLPDLGKNKYDIITASHTLNELWKDDDCKIEKRLAFVKYVAEHLSDGGYLILIEPALLKTSRELIAIRDILAVDTACGLTLVAPCLSSCSPCPALLQGESVTCHCEAGWTEVEPAASLAKAARLDRESVKMTYFVFQKNRLQSKTVSTEGRALVVSDAMLNKAGRVRYVLCDGKKRFTLSAKKGDAVAAGKGFFDLRRYNVIEVTNPELRGDKNNPSFGIGETTTIRHVRA